MFLKYNRSGEGWYKWKKQYEIDAQVIAVDRKPDGYIYTCKVGNITIGDTYLTQIKVNVGDIITVSVDHVTKKENRIIDLSRTNYTRYVYEKYHDWTNQGYREKESYV
jgi:hypothetical protein